MTQSEYLHCSMAGSYWIPCEIIEDDGEEYVIRYHDFVLDEEVETVVTDRSMVRETSLDLGDEACTEAVEAAMAVLIGHHPNLSQQQRQSIAEDLDGALDVHR